MADFSDFTPDQSDFTPDAQAAAPKPDTSANDALNADLGNTEAPSGHDIGLMARGAIGGAASLVTAPADLGIGAVNFVRRHLGLRTLDTNASDVVEKGMTAAGLPEPKTEGETALTGIMNASTGLATGALAGGESAAARAARAADVTGGTGGVDNWWKLAAADGGQNQKILNNAVGQAIGENGVTRITPDVLNRADTRLSAVFDNIRSPNRIYMEDPGKTAAAIAQINEDATPTTKGVLQNETVQKLLAKFQAGKGAISAQDLGNVESELGKAAKAAMKNDYERGAGLFKVQDYVRGLVSEGLPPQQQAVYNQARAQYRVLWGQLLKGNSGLLNPSTGNTNGFALARYLFRTDPEGFALARNTTPMYQAARSAAKQMGDTSLMETVQHAHGEIGSFLKTAARYVPNAAQWVSQVGLKGAVRALANKPGFMTALGSQLDQDSQQSPGP